jgi:D-proline reductase (dithiol) PrdB
MHSYMGGAQECARGATAVRQRRVSTITAHFCAATGPAAAAAAVAAPGGTKAIRGCAPDSFRSYIPSITAHYSRKGFAPYEWHTAEAAPPGAVRLSKPLSQCRLGLLGTAGAYVAGEQQAFSYKDDTSLRKIPSSTSPSRLHFSHITENYLVAGRSDPGCMFPLGTLQELVQRGTLGSLASDALSCMGGIYSVRRVESELVPAAVSTFEEQGVDAVLLVPM